MTIDIQKGKDNKWYVIAYAADGNHHDAFATQQGAVEFALAFYGGKLVVMGAMAA